MNRRFATLGMILAFSVLGSCSALASGNTSDAKVAGAVAHPIAASAVKLATSAPGGFWLGNPQGVPTLTVFLDPNCSVCHEFYEELQPLIHAHKVAVWVLPVGVITPTSLGKAAHVELPFATHTKETAADLLAQSEAGFQKGAQGGHISPVSNPQAQMMVEEHNEVLERLTSLYAHFPDGRIETPVVIARIHGKSSILFGAPPKGAAALVDALHS